jgi:carbamoyl-phosphate synthase small subunit
MREALLVLGDGTTFEGEAIGAAPPGGVATGEVVFNTVLSGYQEVITDPSYAGQVIAFTYPHIGNYGVSPDDHESRRPHCRGVVVRELARRPSSWRAVDDLGTWLTRHRVPGIAGVDTRRLPDVAREAAADAPGTDGVDLVATVSCQAPFVVDAAVGAEQGGTPLRVVAFDYGIKTTILRHLAGIATVEVVPASMTTDDVIARAPHGVFLSNGPGDPAAVGYAVDTIRSLLGRVPIFGICLGHQLLARALDGDTFKLKFGHHGGNHPVRRVETGAVEITSQNHNYAVVDGSIERADVTHVNLNDGVIEGLRCRDVPAFGVQYHPEAGPGPHDARYLFEQFRALMRAGA